MSDYLDPNNEELLKDFYSEAQMQVELMEQNILALEDDPKDQDAIDEIFRAAHTLKGGAATVQMEELSSFTHVLEDLLDAIRGGEVKVSGENVDVLLSSIDIIKAMLASRRNGLVYDEDISGVRANLEMMIAKKEDIKPVEPKPMDKVAQPAPSTKTENEGVKLSEYEKLEMAEAAGSGERVVRVRVTFDESNPMNTVGGIQVFAKLKDLGQIMKTVPDFDALYEDMFHPVVDYYLSTKEDPDHLESSVAISDVTASVHVGGLDEEPEGLPAPEPVSTPAAEQVEEILEVEELRAPVPESPVPDSTKPLKEVQTPSFRKETSSGSVLRVDSQRIDNLLNLVSESVINKATFNQISTQFNEILTELNTAEGTYKDGLKGLFESLPQWLEQIKEGREVKEIKSEINERYGGLYSAFDSFESNLKSAIASFRNTAANLGRNTSDLHEAILRIRMVPISQIFSRFPRLVRDLSKSLDKELDLIIEGEDTELDKSVTEELLDPLMHCVRNSMDHGIESPDIRKRAGKPGRGRLLLKASNEGNMIVIEIADDGAGIDVEKVRNKAIDRGIIHPNKALSDIEAFNLIFEPGFSTAGEVTNISGRGVGLDVVRKQIEKLNGSVAVWSKLGEGTRFTIKLPLTLAIIQGLLVKVGTEIYAIPITSVVESHRIKPEEINIIDNYEVFNVREDVISLLRLGKLFRIESVKDSEYNFVVIVGSGDKKMGLMVDSLIGEEDVVIKPLKDRYTNSPGIAGATILGDGTVSLIIDVSQLLDLGVRKEQEARQNRVVR
jgi:two-component system chemotaxis sensor kinase CheA